ncbi:hypothetical protein IQ229_07495 [Nostoc cf. edaphicum LEGE 07299]|uniref:Uncharacterized protein n=1 Tax=Nostoc cf. edaphicum LEGE 07299 TaxID=2777974 RepID=A0ABR9TWP0_9NOSO|nr:hypothetical protein [Nostoc edaphicum]MBE9104789.1 hypothetical protein [Nostoc cf. edaphicum LEGE 07299]
MTSSWAASHPSLSKTGTRDDPNGAGANAAIAKRHIGVAWEHPLLADRPALRRTLREQTRSLGLYKLNPPARVSESPRRRTSFV